MFEYGGPLPHGQSRDQFSFLILTDRPWRGDMLVKALHSAGIHDCRTAKTISRAAALHRRKSFSCVIFDRAYAPRWEEFFDHFHDRAVWFVPVADALNHMDAIDGLNTRRLSNYLVEPLTEQAIAQTVPLLRERIRMERWERPSGKTSCRSAQGKDGARDEKNNSGGTCGGPLCRI